MPASRSCSRSTSESWSSDRISVPFTNRSVTMQMYQPSATHTSQRACESPRQQGHPGRVALAAAGLRTGGKPPGTAFEHLPSRPQHGSDRALSPALFPEAAPFRVVAGYPVKRTQGQRREIGGHVENAAPADKI